MAIMSRPSKNIDNKLLGLGKKWMETRGLSSLNVRSICKSANVNLGMFVYYFKSKKNFLRIIVKNFFDDIEKEWVDLVVDISDPLEKLKKAILQQCNCIKRKRKTIESIFKGINITDDFYRKIFHQFQEKHYKFYSHLIEACIEKNCFSKEIEKAELFAIIVGSVSLYAKTMILEKPKARENYEIRLNKLFDVIVGKIVGKGGEQE
jgi:AcrR family transcriptional regulator